MTNSNHLPPLELWGGIECTYNRVGDRYFDQIAMNGHRSRLDDLDRIAELGVKAMRYGVVWEQIAPDGLASADWAWTDQALHRLRQHGIEPVVTLVHHGSGPRHTHLLDPNFAEGLAEFALAVARRYPWVRIYTPVNEPLTTARFSGLYGHWYPHERSDQAFVAALLNQIDATALAMQSIRRINPHALLLQTEDIGKIHSVPELAYQAEFENDRRWLTLDLLSGRVDRHHSMWDYLRWAGTPATLLEQMAAEPCPPDLIGINHYLTSERFLDDRVERYPAHTHGRNGRHHYADVEAVRALEEVAGWDGIIAETAARYRLPLVISEAHLGGHRCDQVRWLAGAWNAAVRARGEGGIDLRAVTVWALLGSHNWHSLVTRDDGHYEPGAFDVRGGTPRPTAIAAAMRELAAGNQIAQPALYSPGWWQRADRFFVREDAARLEERIESMGPQVIAIAPDQVVAEPLLTRIRLRHLGGAFIPWRGEVLATLIHGRNVWSTVIAIPTLDGREIVALLDLLNAMPKLSIAVIAGRVTDEPDTTGLIGCVYSRALVVDLRRHRGFDGEWPDIRRRSLSDAFWDDVLDLLIDGATGRWEMTDDGVLVSTTPRPANDRVATTSLIASGDKPVDSTRPLDGFGRIR